MIYKSSLSDFGVSPVASAILLVAVFSGCSAEDLGNGAAVFSPEIRGLIGGTLVV